MSARGRRPITRWATRWAAVLAVLWILAAVALTAEGWSTLRAAHPAHLVGLGAMATVGALLVVRARRLRDRKRDPRRRPAWRVTGRTLAAVATAVVLAAMIYLRPLGASDVALAAMESSPGVRVDDSMTRIVLAPTDGEPERGLVFQPGARVDPRAYVPMLAQVSRTGVLVVIVKQPFELGLAAVDAPGDVVEEHPEVETWAVGGHSLGGVAASSYAGGHPGQVDGLVLWASYPQGSLADSGLTVASIYGTNDRLTTPEDVDGSRPDLPEDTAYTAVPGAVHAYFGDYGPQAGDGAATTSRVTAQAQIVRATIALLATM